MSIDILKEQRHNLPERLYQLLSAQVNSVFLKRTGETGILRVLADN